MVKSRKRSSLYRRPFLVVVIILLIALAGLYVAKLLTKSPVETKTPDDTQLVEADNEKEDVDLLIEKNTDDGKSEIIQNEGVDPNTLENLTGTITAARISGLKVIIRVNLDQYLSSGACSLVMVNGDKTYSDSVNIIDSASTSTCEGFDIPVSELSSGTWSIAIGISSGGKTGNISGEVSL